MDILILSEKKYSEDVWNSSNPNVFAKTFNDYPHKTKMPSVDVTNKCDKIAIQDLLQYAIGYGYWMVHGGGPGGVKIDI